MLKESAKRYQSNTIYTDVLQLLQTMLDLAPWTKASSENWQNLRQGLVIFFANNKQDNVKEMFIKLPADIQDEMIKLNEALTSFKEKEEK